MPLHTALYPAGYLQKDFKWDLTGDTELQRNLFFKRNNNLTVVIKNTAILSKQNPNFEGSIISFTYKPFVELL